MSLAGRPLSGPPANTWVELGACISDQTPAPDPAAELLLDCEVGALKPITGVCFDLTMIMAPVVWLLSFSTFNRIATFPLLAVYLIVLAFSILIGGGGERVTLRLVGYRPDSCKNTR